MTGSTVLVVGNTVITSWGRDQIRRLSEQARWRGLSLIGADTPGNLAAASEVELSRVDEIVALDVHDAEACRAWAATRSDIDAVLTIRVCRRDRGAERADQDDGSQGGVAFHRHPDAGVCLSQPGMG